MFVLGVTKIEFKCWVSGFLSFIVRVDLWALLCMSEFFLYSCSFFFLCRPPTSRNIPGVWISAGSQWYQELIWKRFMFVTINSKWFIQQHWIRVTWCWFNTMLTAAWPPDLFVSGNDPLTDDESNHDINSVAGVLKLYFRGLENPLFPKERFNDLLACISKNTHLTLFYTDHTSLM